MSGAQEAVPGEFIVQLNSGTRLFSSADAKVISQDLRLVLVRRPSVETAGHSMSVLRNDPAVEMVEPNYIFKIDSELPNDPMLGEQWGLLNTGQATAGEGGKISGKPGIDINAAAAWAVKITTSAIAIAVIDTGVDYTNLDLAPALMVNELEQSGQPNVDDDLNSCVDDFYGCDFVNTDGDPLDDHGHGSHITGIIGARGNNQNGIAGIVWCAEILAVKAFDSAGLSTTAKLIAAMEYARKRNVKIINASWGSPSYGTFLNEVFKRARESGILVVTAAGNAGTSLENTPEFPASYDFDNIITVASIDPDGSFSKFSNYGNVSVDIVAPGNNILSYGLTGMESKKGTSMAAPHVTGVAALLWAQDDSQDYKTVRSRLLNGIRPMGFLRSRTSSGGMLNALSALTNTPGAVDLNEPYFWRNQSYPLSSAHPYLNDQDQTWTAQVQGASRLAVHFKLFDTEANLDYIEIKDSTGKLISTETGHRGEHYTPEISGDTVVIRFKSDGTVSRYGWEIDHIAYQ